MNDNSGIDSVGTLRPTDSWSCTEVKILKHSHIWTVKGFPQCECRYLETSVRPLQNDPSIIFRIRLHPQGNKDSNKDFTFFQVFCNKNDTKYQAKFQVLSSRNEEIATTVYTGQQQLHGYFEYIRRDLLLTHLQPSDELNLLCDLSITCDTVTKSSTKFAGATTPSSSKESRQELQEKEVASDLAQLFRDEKLTDFLLICGSREIPVHKGILAARSPVFNAMFEHNTAESQNGCVVIDDIDPDVLYEMVTYIYSGKAPNINEMAPDLLAGADRFSLPGLKDMADQVLRSNLSTDSVCRSLVLSSMYSSSRLKAESIRFIAQNAPQVITTDGWQKMLRTNADLVTEAVAAIASGEPSSTLNRTSTERIIESEPYLKRNRKY